MMRATLLTLLFTATLLPGVALAQTATAGKTAPPKTQARAAANKTDPDGTTALHWAVRNNDVAQMDRLLRAGANPNAANRYGITPIHLACENGSAAAVARLLKAGVS